jgi:hypothetical protein
VKLFVEGGGTDSSSLRNECRAAFRLFLQKSGLTGHMPRIVACGSRNDAYADYCRALDNGEDALLLVDSEESIVLPQNGRCHNANESKTWNPWYHLEISANWTKPQNAREEACHLMVQLMEAWFLADVETLKEYYGEGFNEHNLPKRTDIENIDRDIVGNSLRRATIRTKKGVYDKGKHSFEILKIIDPKKVMARSPWTQRFVTLLSEKMQSVHE